jgi:restriction endonuclease S subunit
MKMSKKSPVYKLKDIAEIHSGISFRSELSSEEGGEAVLVQMKNLGNLEVLDIGSSSRSFTKIKNSSFKPVIALRSGDLLFRSKGFNFTAAKVANSLSKVFPVAPLYLIRINSDKVIPDYVLWLINHSETQKYFNQMAKGTTIMMISRQILEDMELKIPNLKTQERIAKIMELYRKEKILIENLAVKKKIYLEAALMVKI